ncbi:MAG: histidine kinase [Coriobacteriia bacterium]|nr:histidine kinase [Coriobacteriia bacterium]
MYPGRRVLIDVALMTTVAALTVIAGASLAFRLPRYVTVAAIAGLVMVAMGMVVARFITRPDHLRAMQSHSILDIANASLAHLRRGLDGETAQEVCRLALTETEAAAVAITDTERILGFAGIGEDHHHTGGPILTRATCEALETNEHRILETRTEIGCSKRDCLLRAAIVVPLEMRGQAVGTLKFYYTTPRLLNETQVTMVEGLAKLLSTQLELSELELQTQLATRMELKALQAQINPHFLFNTINTIAMLIRTDPAEARRLLRDFATFYRRTLDTGDELIPLERELEYVRAYVSFERARFGDRVSVTETVAREALGVQVPAFILQPIVENAIQHGMRPREPLHVRIEAELADGCLLLHVLDDGVGIEASRLPVLLEPGAARGLGIALRNVHDRLRGNYGPGSGLEVESREGEGTKVTLTLQLEPGSRCGADEARVAGGAEVSDAP